MKPPKDMRFRAPAGKGPLPRPIKIEAQQEGFKRIWGERETWWEKRDREKREAKSK